MFQGAGEREGNNSAVLQQLRIYFPVKVKTMVLLRGFKFWLAFDLVLIGFLKLGCHQELQIDASRFEHTREGTSAAVLCA